VLTYLSVAQYNAIIAPMTRRRVGNTHRERLRLPARPWSY
jgi:hypothetical protein